MPITAVGWMMTIPMMIRSQSPSTRRRRTVPGSRVEAVLEGAVWDTEDSCREAYHSRLETFEPHLIWNPGLQRCDVGGLELREWHAHVRRLLPASRRNASVRFSVPGNFSAYSTASHSTNSSSRS